LVLPITYFIEKPFQNWTRVTADILGTVFIYVDYTVPVQAIREELHRILKKTDLWDGKAWVLQLTNTTERTVELRALMSAPDAPTAWNLRCEVREKLIELTSYQGAHPQGISHSTPGGNRTSGFFLVLDGGVSSSEIYPLPWGENSTQWQCPQHF
jgi:hypothetical protein